MTEPSPQKLIGVNVVIKHPRPEPWTHVRQKCPPWARGFFYCQWLGEWAAHFLSSWSFVSVLEYMGTLSLLVAVTTYFLDAPARLEQRHFQAWQVINTAQGKGGSGGRIEALKDLNDDHVPLVGVDLSDAFLQRAQLPGANLRRCTMKAADLMDSDLHGADMSDSALTFANFRRADLRGVNFSQTVLDDADLSGAKLNDAQLDAAQLARADLRGADLSAIKDFEKITDMTLANVDGVANAPSGFVAWAKAHGAVAIKDDDAWAVEIRKATKEK